MQTPPHSAARMDIISLTETNNTTENDTAGTDEPIDHCTRARRTTPWPSTTPLPATNTQLDHKPVSRLTLSHINPEGIAQQVDMSPRQESQWRFPCAFIHQWSMPVMDTVTGENLEYRQIRSNPKYKKTWNQSYSNELGRLCQIMGNGSKGPQKQCIKGTETFRIIRYEDIPVDCRNKITYTKVFCEYRSHKEYPNRMRITIGGNRICYPGDVGTPTGSLELVKLIINSVLSHCNACFAAFDVSNFYLATPINRPEFFRIRLEYISKEFIEEYNLIPYSNNWWIYFEIIKGWYVLPQAGMLAFLNKTGYYETTTKTEIWRHKWRPIMFVLIVDDFGIEYVGNNHLHHIRTVRTNHYTITEDLDGKKNLV